MGIGDVSVVNGRILMICGAVLLYAASQAGVAALAGHSNAPGRRALGHWMPIAAAAIFATFFHRADLALAIVFSTSVASLSLVLGSIAVSEPDSEVPPSARRNWPFLLPASILPLLAGFSGHLTWVHAVMLILEGIVLLALWLEPARQKHRSESSGLMLSEDHDLHRDTEPAVVNHLNLALAIMVALVGGAAAASGATKIAGTYSASEAVLVIVVALGPMLVVPMLVTGTGLARHRRAWVPIGTSVGVVLLNLCALLPAVILLNYPAQGIHIIPGNWRASSFAWPGQIVPMAYSIITWRVDNVVLMVLAFILLPISLSRWRLGKAEGTVLVGLYAVYVLMEVVASSHI
jgi:cation:H+ antiporter